MGDRTAGQEEQAKLLDTVRKSQDAVLEAINRWVEVVKVVTGSISDPNLSFTHNLPEPAELSIQRASSESRVPRVVSVGKEGRITVPADLRQAFRLQEGTQVVIYVDKIHGGLVLQPAVTIPRDPAWVSEAEHRTRLERSYADADAGRTKRMSDDLVEQLLQE